MRAVLLPSGDVAFSPDVLAAIAPGMVRQLEEARRLQVDVPDDVVASIELADMVGAAWRNRRVALPQTSADCRRVDMPASEPSRWISVSEATAMFETLGRPVTERAVRLRCEKGALRAEKVLGAWRIDPDSVKECV